MFKKIIKRIKTFISYNTKRKKYKKEFMGFLDNQSKTVQRPIALLGMFCWLDFAFNTDPKLHPEFPELFYFRMGLSVVCGISFILTFFENWRGKGQGLLYFMGAYIGLSCGFFTGRIANDASYVAGFQIVLLLSVLMPCNRKALSLLVIGALTAFITAVVIYRPSINNPSSIYSMNNLLIVFFLGIIMVFLNDRLRFAIFYDRMKLDESNHNLIKARDELWGEMELAKKIQMALLPVKPSIEGFEISAYMKPADEVGGDYYDVINAGGMDWIMIGDVSGHGVTTGLIMMMAQTSIQTVLTNNSSLEPSELLAVVNETITANMAKLNEDKYMTITVIAYCRHGTFCFSGLHQDILIYRKKTRSVELVPTSGMWIGIMQPLAGLVKDEHFILEKGDVVLLYTDGITESWIKGSLKDQRDPVTAMYSAEKLIEVFADLGEKTTNDIVQGILASLENYQPNDDITMLVMKYLHD